MKIKKEIVIESFLNLTKSTTNKFWGLLAILHSIDEPITPNKTYTVDSSKLMSNLDKLFTIVDSKQLYVGNPIYVKFSLAWKDIIEKDLLKNKPMLFDCAIFYHRNAMMDVSSTDSRKLINNFLVENKIILNGLEFLFEIEGKNSVIEFEDYNNDEFISGVASAKNVENKSGQSLSLESPFFIQSRASELKRAPFIQTLYSGDKIKELLLLSDTNLELLYPSQNILSKESENFEALFRKWLENNFAPKSGSLHAYILSINILSEKLSKNLFSVDDLPYLQNLYNDVKDNQSVKGSFFYCEKSPSYGEKGFLSAALSSYIKFIAETQKNRNSPTNNTIYYGAPGTGKSYRVDQIIKDLDPQYFERVTFHPEYDNASFVGGYKPVSQRNEKGEEEIGYRFVPQAFSTIYSRAWQDPTQPYYLVIEEINRGNCAEIFGEIFQLLDRNSEYTVTPSKELREHLLKDFSDNPEHEGIRKGLKLPSNLHILATMNTSDQSLFPMDSAFKRRWEWEYVPICYDPRTEEDKDNLSFGYEIELPDGTKYRWIDFISKINNNHIKNNPSLGMDKCIGNYFIKPDSGNFITLKPFISKVIFYLWNDVFKDEDNKVFESNGSYEDFFPIASAGVTKVKELFERIELSPISAYAERDEEYQLGQVAEENQTFEN